MLQSQTHHALGNGLTLTGSGEQAADHATESHLCYEGLLSDEAKVSYKLSGNSSVGRASDCRG